MNSEMMDFWPPNPVTAATLKILIKDYLDADEHRTRVDQECLNAYIAMISFGFHAFHVGISIMRISQTNQYQFKFTNPGTRIFLDYVHQELPSHTSNYCIKEIKKRLLHMSLMLIIKGYYDINLADMKTSPELVEKLVNTKNTDVDVLLTENELQELLLKSMITTDVMTADNNAVSFVPDILQNHKRCIKELFIVSGDNGKSKNSNYTSNVYTTKPHGLVSPNSSSGDSYISDETSIMGSSERCYGSTFSSPLSNRQLSLEMNIDDSLVPDLNTSNSNAVVATSTQDEDTTNFVANSTAAAVTPNRHTTNATDDELAIDDSLVPDPDASNSTAAVTPDRHTTSCTDEVAMDVNLCLHVNASNSTAAVATQAQDDDTTNFVANGMGTIDGSLVPVPDPDASNSTAAVVTPNRHAASSAAEMAIDENYKMAYENFLKQPIDVIIQQLMAELDEIITKKKEDFCNGGLNLTGNSDGETTTDTESLTDAEISLFQNSAFYATRSCMRRTVIDKDYNLQYNENLKTLNENSAIRIVQAMETFRYELENHPQKVIELIITMNNLTNAPQNSLSSIGSSAAGGSDIHMIKGSVLKKLRPLLEKYGIQIKNVKVDADKDGKIRIYIGWMGCGRCQEIIYLLWKYEFNFEIVFEIVEIDILVVESCFRDKYFLLFLCFRNALNNGKNKVIHRWADGLDETFEFTESVDILYSTATINALAYYGFIRKAPKAKKVMILSQVRDKMNAARNDIRCDKNVGDGLEVTASHKMILSESSSSRNLVTLTRRNGEMTDKEFGDIIEEIYGTLYVSFDLFDIHHNTNASLMFTYLFEA